MKLSKVKEILAEAKDVNFELPNGTVIPEHFHVTEIGSVTKNFIDCGGTLRNEKVINFQLWFADDFDHRLKPQKFTDIIALSEEKLGLEDLDIEVEYQSDTIGKYDLDFNGNNFVLLQKQTDCLAPDKCGVPETKKTINLSNLIANSNGCEPGSGCC